jgi:hypothetical protein
MTVMESKPRPDLTDTGFSIMSPNPLRETAFGATMQAGVGHSTTLIRLTSAPARICSVW